MPNVPFPTDLTVAQLPKPVSVSINDETREVVNKLDLTSSDGPRNLRNRDFWHALPDIRSARRRGRMQNWFSGIVAAALTVAGFGLFISRCAVF